MSTLVPGREWLHLAHTGRAPPSRLASQLKVLLKQLFLLAAAVLEPELNLGPGEAEPLGEVSLAIVGDKAAALVLLLQLGPLICGIPLEGARPP